MPKDCENRDSHKEIEDIEWRLPRHPRSVSRARTLLRDQATAWKLPDEVTETAALLLSELMTNAYRHAKVSPGREIWARCSMEADRLRISVSDANDTPSVTGRRVRTRLDPGGSPGGRVGSGTSHRRDRQDDLVHAP